MAVHGVFISYRRDDAAPYARLLGEALATRFGTDRIFRDVDTLAPGVDFPDAIASALASCGALVALIGPGWLNAEKDGRRRLDDPSDYVRLEIATALGRDVLVVPVLVEATPMPSREQLPDALAELADRNALRLTDAAWADAIGRLTAALEAAVGPGAADGERGRPSEDAGGGRRITADIRGDVSGQVALGDHIVQERTVVTDAVDVDDRDRAALARAFSHLRARARAALPAAVLARALDRVDDLEDALQGDDADPATVEYVEAWFADHAPALADAVAGVTRHPVVRRLREARDR